MFSIIVPIHNAEKTIERCVESLIEQDEKAQIILVENGSADNTLNVCQHLKEKHTNIELYISDKTGVSAARNKGLLHAVGDIIGFCDSDDYYEKNILKSIETVFINNHVDMVITAYTSIDDEVQDYHSYKHRAIVGRRKAIDLVTCNPEVFGSVWNKFYKKESIKGMMFPEDLTHMEDEFFNVSFLTKRKSRRVFISDMNTYYYIRNHECTTYSAENSFDKNNMLKYNNVLHRMQQELDLTCVEKKSIQDKLYRMSVSWLLDPRIKDNRKAKERLYDEVASNIVTFTSRIFKYDSRYKMRILREGIKILFREKNSL